MADSDLFAAFLTQFDHSPTHEVEAPGRVNLIGDHTDYNDLPVLPIAIRQRVRLVLRPRDDETIRIVPLATGFDPTSFRVSHDIVPEADGHWSNYLRGAAQAVARLSDRGARGFDALLFSDVPVAAGLSSSSALVVSVVMALLELNRSEPGSESISDLSPLEVASLAARAERYVGTEGGGMDQAASVCGQAGHALHIGFAPLRVVPIAIPESWRFIVAHSGAVAEKSGAREADYNARVSSCRNALAHMEGVVGGTLASTYPALVGSSTEGELLRLAEAELSLSELRPFRHTVTEAHRVEAAADALIHGDAALFGSLMTASHRSLAQDYEVSTPLLDAMVHAALEAGAFGARLTGAGFGGSVVALTPEATASTVLAALSSIVAPTLDGAEPTAFVAVASDGARVTALS